MKNFLCVILAITFLLTCISCNHSNRSNTIDVHSTESRTKEKDDVSYSQDTSTITQDTNSNTIGSDDEITYEYEDDDYLYLKDPNLEQPTSNRESITYEEFIQGDYIGDNIRVAKSIEMSSLSSHTGVVRVQVGDVFLGYKITNLEQQEVLIGDKWFVLNSYVTLIGGKSQIIGSISYQKPEDGPASTIMSIKDDYKDFIPVILVGDGHIFSDELFVFGSTLILPDTNGEYTTIDNIKVEITNINIEYRTASSAYYHAEVKYISGLE